MKKSKEIIIVLICVFMSNLAFSWTDSTCNYMAIKAFSAFPKDLRISLNRYRKDFINGSKFDFPDYSKDQLIDFSLKKAKDLKKMLKNGKNFKDISYNLGIYSKCVSLISYPFNENSDVMAKDYKLFAEKKIFKFFYVYSPVYNEDIENLSLKNKLENLRFLGNSFKDSIENDYKFFKKSENFDDLSASFGAASILFSETCLTISKSVGNLWKSAGGSAKDVPFLLSK